MAVEEEVRTVREAIGVFNRPEELQGAIDELLSSGFYRAELSLLASAHAVEAKLDHRYEKVSSLADDPTVPRDILTICKSRWIVEACCYGCVPGSEDDERAVRILRKYSAMGAHVHALPANNITRAGLPTRGAPGPRHFAPGAAK